MLATLIPMHPVHQERLASPAFASGLHSSQRRAAPSPVANEAFAQYRKGEDKPNVIDVERGIVIPAAAV
jgi:hypothetical protein